MADTTSKTFTENVNHVAELDNSLGHELALRRSNIVLNENVTYSALTEVRLFNRATQMTETVSVPSAGVTAAGLNTYLETVKAALELAYPECVMTHSVAQTVSALGTFNNAQLSVVLSGNDYYLRSINIKISEADGVQYDIDGQLVSPLEITPKLLAVSSETLLAIDSIVENELNINAVAANEANIDAVAESLANVNTIASIQNLANMTTVANDLNAMDLNGIADVTVVANNLVLGAASSINIVSADKANIDAVASNKANIDAVAANEANINAVIGSAIATAADVLLTHADVVLTGADVISADTSADVATAQAGIATTKAGEALASANASAASAALAEAALGDITSLSASATTLSAGASATASYNSGTGILYIGVPQGIQGAIGATGAAGRGISSVARTDGNGGAGTTDTYTITYSDATTSAFNVYNGADGLSSDMLKATYDTNNNGVVDNAALVNGLSVLTAVPSGALFTDTVYTHPNTDGNLHVPATGTTNSGKVLTAGGTAGSLSWVTPAAGVTNHTLLSNIGTNTHAQIDTALTRLANTSGSNTGDQDLSGYSLTSHAHSGTYQPASNDLSAIDALAGASGLLKKTATDTWTLDTNTYVTSSGVTSVTGTAPIVSSGGNTPAISMAAASSGVNGYMTGTYATKLDGIAANANNYTLPVGSSTVIGGTKLFSDVVQSVVANAVSATASRSYGLQLNASGQLVVNVPWDDTNTFPTTYTWTNGTTAGPTASITGTSSTIAVAAIPSASATVSGVVTTGAQTFAGIKTLTSPIFVTPNIGVATGTSFNSITGLASVAPFAPAVAAAIGTSTLAARQDHMHPTNFTATATDIKMNGIQSVGSLITFARADHVHPVDTSRAPLASPTFTGTPTAPTATVGTNTTELATTAFTKAEITAMVSGANVLLSANGYQKLPSGLIIQWGSVDFAGIRSTAVAVTFPIAFPNGVLSINNTSLTTLDETATYSISSSVRAVTNTGAIVQGSTYAGYNAITGFKWIAIGY